MIVIIIIIGIIIIINIFNSNNNHRALHTVVSVCVQAVIVLSLIVSTGSLKV